jgi:hypothetical protein
MIIVIVVKTYFTETSAHGNRGGRGYLHPDSNGPAQRNWIELHEIFNMNRLFQINAMSIFKRFIYRLP